MNKETNHISSSLTQEPKHPLSTDCNYCDDLYMGEDEAVLKTLQEIFHTLGEVDNRNLLCQFIVDRFEFIADSLAGRKLSELEKLMVTNRLTFDPYHANFDVYLKKEIDGKTDRIEFDDKAEAYTANGRPFEKSPQLNGNVFLTPRNDGIVMEFERINNALGDDGEDAGVSTDIIYAFKLLKQDTLRIDPQAGLVLVGNQSIALKQWDKKGDELPDKNVDLTGFLNVTPAVNDLNATVELYLKFRDPGYEKHA